MNLFWKNSEGSGLRPGKDFKREVVFRTDEGTKRPDVVIYLPKGRHVVVDSKVSSMLT